MPQLPQPNDRDFTPLPAGALTPDELDELARGWREESLAALDRARKLVEAETARAIIEHADRSEQ